MERRLGLRIGWALLATIPAKLVANTHTTPDRARPDPTSPYHAIPHRTGYAAIVCSLGLYAIFSSDPSRPLRNNSPKNKLSRQKLCFLQFASLLSYFVYPGKWAKWAYRICKGEVEEGVVVNIKSFLLFLQSLTIIDIFEEKLQNGYHWIQWRYITCIYIIYEYLNNLISM